MSLFCDVKYLFSSKLVHLLYKIKYVYIRREITELPDTAVARQKILFVPSENKYEHCQQIYIKKREKQTQA